MPRRRQAPPATRASPSAPDPVSMPGPMSPVELDSAWMHADTIGPPSIGESAPDTRQPGDEFLRRIPTLPDLLGELGLLPDLSDAGPGPMGAAAKLIARVGRKGREVGKRIAPGGQSSVPAELKVQRFRSPAGDFVRYENQWWRIKPFKADSPDIELEFLGEGPKTLDSKIVARKVVPMKTFYAKIQKANQQREKAKAKGK